MADDATNVPSPSHQPNGKFAKGNKLSKSRQIIRHTQLARTQIHRYAKLGKAIPRSMKALIQIATKGSRTVQYRERVKNEVTGEMETKRVRVEEPVTDKVQLVAIDTLFSRIVGKATEFKVIEDNREQANQGGGTDIARAIELLLKFRTPIEHWPTQARAYYEQQQQAKQVESKVIELEKPDGGSNA